ncbi:MAG: hypothetical protein QXR96_02365, partial [Candidatus Woesearchaeota archaeon]
ILSWQTNYNDIGFHNVLLKVQDSKGSYALQNFTINVFDVNDVPIIVSQPITETNVFDYYVYDVDAVDYDNDTLIYSLIEKPKFMYINRQNGKIIWVPFKKGLYKVVVEVYDRKSSSIQEFYINVSDNKKGNFFIGKLNNNFNSYLEIENSNMFLKRISINLEKNNPLLVSGYNKNNIYYVVINDLKQDLNNKKFNASLYFAIPKNYGYDNITFYNKGKKLISKKIKEDFFNYYYNVDINNFGVFYFYTKYHEIISPKKKKILTGKLNFLNAPITEGIEYEIINLKTNETKKGITSNKFNAYAELIDADYNDEVKITLLKENKKLDEKTIKITGDVVRQDVNLSITKEDYLNLLNKDKLKSLFFSLFIFLTFVLVFAFVYKKVRK